MLYLCSIGSQIEIIELHGVRWIEWYGLWQVVRDAYLLR